MKFNTYSFCVLFCCFLALFLITQFYKMWYTSVEESFAQAMDYDVLPPSDPFAYTKYSTTKENTNVNVPIELAKRK